MTSTKPQKRQFCCNCNASTSDYRTLLFRSGTARFHYCQRPECQARFTVDASRPGVWTVP
jgi:hypothetical protein